MTKEAPKIAALLILAILAVSFIAAPAMAGIVLPDDNRQEIQAITLQLPLLFIQNQGQAADDVKFHASAAGHTITFMPDGIVLRACQEENDVNRSAEVTMTFPSASASPEIVGLDRQPGDANFYLGNDPSRWREDVPIYGAIEYLQLYPGIDLCYRGTEGVLKREFIVAPGSDPNQIAIAFDGIQGLALDEDGSLAITTPLGVLTDQAPIAFQDVEGFQVPVAVSYRIIDDRTVGFVVGEYDPSLPLVIDPTLLYSSFFGGSTSATYIYRVRTDTAGNIYLAGRSTAIDLPVLNAYQGSHAGTTSTYDAYVAELSPDGTSVLYLTYFGGSLDDCVQGLNLDGAGNIYLSGATKSDDFPLLSSFISTRHEGITGFAAKLSPSNPPGSQLVYSTYIGAAGDGYYSSSYTTANAIVADSSGNAWIAGYTRNGTLPVTVDADQPTLAGGYESYLSKITSAGSLSYLTYLGGSGDEGSSSAAGGVSNCWPMGLGLDPAGNVYVGGFTKSVDFPVMNAYDTTPNGATDTFVAKYNSSGGKVYATYLGGSTDDSGRDLAVDASGAVYLTGTVTGSATSTDFPLVNPAQAAMMGKTSAFVTKIAPSGTELVYSTFWGGTGTSSSTSNIGYGIDVDSSGNAYVSGYSSATDFPIVNGIRAYGATNGFVLKLAPSGNPALYSTEIGGTPGSLSSTYFYGIALNNQGDAVAAGATADGTYPITTNAIKPAFPGGWNGALAILTDRNLPTASFTADLLEGDAPLEVQFNDTSTGDPTSWAWDFGDGGTSNGQNPVHTYTSAGLFTVNLTVTNTDGSDSEEIADYINVTEPAGPSGPTPLPDIRHIFIGVANDDGVKYDLDGPVYGGPDNTYYIKADGGGLNELHISNDAGEAYGQVSTSSDQSGVFYVTNTGGRGFDDTIVLLLAVNGTIPDDFSVHIKTSGYNWTTSSIANQLPTDYIYTEGAVDETFTKADFIYGPQTWKPGPGTLGVPSLPLYFGQDISDTTNPFQLMFIDLKVGNMYPSKFSGVTLENAGASKVEYSFNNLTSFASFNGYGWCLAANQGQGISWTNRLDDPGASGFSVVGVPYTPSPAPVANFTADPLEGEAPLEIRFNDTSSGDPTGWAWDFGDGDATNATEQNPVHTYTDAGTYTVTLTVTNAAGTDSEVKTDYITVSSGSSGGDAPVANFTASATSGSVPLFVRFTDTSTGDPTSWAWDFGDGSTGTDNVTTHTYMSAGTYTVTLIATNAAGSDSEVKTGYITVSESSGGSGLANSAWPGYMHDINHTGQSPYNGPQTNTVQWTYTTGGRIMYSSPVIGTDGTIYFGSYDKNFYAVNPNGTVKWTYPTGGSLQGAAAIGADGTIYVGNYGDKKIYALNPDGSEQWNYTTGGTIRSLTIGPDGTIYHGNNDKNIYALNPDGTLKWATLTTGSFSGTPAIGSDGTIYIGSKVGDSRFYALNPDGSLKWTYAAGGPISDPAIGSDGTIYFGTSGGDNKLYAMNTDATLKWSYQVSESIYGTPAIGTDDTLYFGDNGGSISSHIYALNPDGTLKWSVNNGRMYGSAVIGADGTIYFASYGDKTIYALNPDGTIIWSYLTGAAEYDSPSIGADGTLYFGSYNGNLYAFHDASPVANFTANVTSGEAPLAVQFTDLSTGSPTSWAWDFENDGTTDATTQNASYTYSTAGTYTVNLTVANAAGSDSEVKTDYITVTEPSGPTVLPGYNNIFVYVANDAGVKYDFFGNDTYNIRFEGINRGLNALHVSTDPAENFGQVTVTDRQSGTFYATDSGGKGYEDEILLLVAVNGTIPDDFSMRITSDGYTWTPNPVPNQPPDLGTVVYQPVALDETFTKADFMYGPQIWKPTGNEVDYPLFAGQDMGDTGNTFRLMFVDLNSGVLRPNGALQNQGAVRINYSFQNPGSFATFSVYAYCNSSNNGDGMVAWTNALTPDKAMSGYSVYRAVSPGADFTANVTSGTAPLAVHFTDSSTGIPTTWSWDFGDGTGSTAQNPGHTYTTTGTYTVNLTVANAAGTDSEVKTDYITVTSGSSGGDAPVAAFTSDVQSGTAPLTVQFTDESLNIPTSWAWDFENDGVIDSTEQNPSHTYTTAGTCTVNLTVANAAGSDSEVKTDYITVGESGPAAPVAAFSANVTTGNAPLEVQFTDESTNSPTSWSWTFGDGGTSIEHNPAHIYTSAGTYTVTLTATNAGGSDIETKTGYVQAYETDAVTLIVTPQSSNVPVGSVRTYSFSINSLPDGLSGYNVSAALTNPAVGEITGFTLPAWAVLNSSSTFPADSGFFGGVDLGQLVQNDAENVPFGTITVRADATGTTGLVFSMDEIDDELGYPITVSVGNAVLNAYHPVVADFTADVTGGKVPFTVSFTGLSTGDPAPTSCAWDFDGNGTTDSTAWNPTHEYTVPGRYNVSLTVTGPYNQDTMTKTGYIVATRTVQPFPGQSLMPRDPNFDGLYEDINGNGRLDFDDVVVFYKNMAWVRNNSDVGITPYDFNGNGLIDYDDVVHLFQEVVHS